MRRDRSASRVRQDLSVGDRRFGLLVARFNEDVTDELLRGALDCLRAHGASEERVDVYRVPGAWELPQAAARLVDAGRHHALVALGCVVRGETPHFDYICAEASRGLGAVAREARIPLTFGVLTTDSLEQARARADRGEGNKGWEAALAALEMAHLYDRIVASG